MLPPPGPPHCALTAEPSAGEQKDRAVVLCLPYLPYLTPPPSSCVRASLPSSSHSLQAGTFSDSFTGGAGVPLNTANWNFTSGSCPLNTANPAPFCKTNPSPSKALQQVSPNRLDVTVTAGQYFWPAATYANQNDCARNGIPQITRPNAKYGEVLTNGGQVYSVDVAPDAWTAGMARTGNYTQHGICVYDNTLNAQVKVYTGSLPAYASARAVLCLYLQYYDPGNVNNRLYYSYMRNTTAGSPPTVAPTVTYVTAM